jgi:hypothetical protein
MGFFYCLHMGVAQPLVDFMGGAFVLKHGSQLQMHHS